ncbi:MAG: Calx-beta domain-containing protein, partial [Planctomycetota bacterium]
LEDDDCPNAGEFQLSGTPYTVQENDGTFTVTVSRLNGSTGEVSVDFLTLDVASAVEGTDYEEASGTLTWADGDTADKTFDVTILDNTVPVGVDKQFLVRLQNPSPSACARLANTLTEAFVALEDDDCPNAGEFSKTTTVRTRASSSSAARLTRSRRTTARSP